LAEHREKGAQPKEKRRNSSSQKRENTRERNVVMEKERNDSSSLLSTIYERGGRKKPYRWPDHREGRRITESGKKKHPTYLPAKGILWKKKGKGGRTRSKTRAPEKVRPDQNEKRTEIGKKALEAPPRKKEEGVFRSREKKKGVKKREKNLPGPDEEEKKTPGRKGGGKILKRGKGRPLRL